MLLLFILSTGRLQANESCFDSNSQGIRQYVSANSSIEKKVQPGSRIWKWSFLTREAGQGGRCPNYFLQLAISEQTEYWQNRKNNCKYDNDCIANANAEIQFLSSMSIRQSNARRVQAEIQRESCSLLQRSPQKKDCKSILAERFDQHFMEKLNTTKNNSNTNSCAAGAGEAIREIIQSALDVVIQIPKKIGDSIGFLGCKLTGACSSLDWGEMSLANDVNSVWQSVKNINPNHLVKDVVASLQREYKEVYQCMTESQKVLFECQFMTFMGASLTPLALAKLPGLLKSGQFIFKLPVKSGEPYKIEFITELTKVVPKERRLPSSSKAKLDNEDIIDVQAKVVSPKPVSPKIENAKDKNFKSLPQAKNRNSVNLNNDQAEMDRIKKPIQTINDIRLAVGLGPEANYEQIKQQIRKLSGKYHPDKNPDLSDVVGDVQKSLNKMRKILRQYDEQ